MSDPVWQHIGNIELVLMTLSYLACLLLFFILRPQGIMEWTTTAERLGIFLVLANACLVVFFGLATDQPTRVVVFGVGTVLCWLFTIVAYHDWIGRRGWVKRIDWSNRRDWIIRRKSRP